MEAVAAEARLGPSEREATATAAALLNWETRLLDGRRYREWLELLTSDCLYWIPTNLEPSNPRRESGVNLDDKRRLIDRIVVIEIGLLRAQDPPSRTCRMIGNVEAWNAGTGSIAVRSNIVIWEHRRGTTDR